MADETRKIKISNDTDDFTTESSDAPGDAGYDYDDDDRPRQTINLDMPGDLADAVAAASRISVPPAEPASEKRSAVDAASVAEPPAAPSAPSASEAEVKKLRDEARVANDNYLRALADLQNFRRRGEEERARIIRDGNEKLIKEILPVLDDFDLALGAAKQSESYDQLIGGVEAILRKFSDTLAKEGVEPIETVGSHFDPDLHEAVMLDEASDEPDETVTAELRRGYTLHKRVIRPALVKVAKHG